MNVEVLGYVNLGSLILGAILLSLALGVQLGLGITFLVMFHKAVDHV